MTRLCLLLGLLTLFVRAEPPVPVDVLIARLNSDAFKERIAARKALVERIQDLSHPGLTELFATRYAESPEVREQADAALREIFDLHVLGSGRRATGADWIYWIDFKDGKNSGMPGHPHAQSGKLSRKGRASDGRCAGINVKRWNVERRMKSAWKSARAFHWLSIGS